MQHRLARCGPSPPRAPRRGPPGRMGMAPPALSRRARRWTTAPGSPPRTGSGTTSRSRGRACRGRCASSRTGGRCGACGGPRAGSSRRGGPSSSAASRTAAAGASTRAPPAPAGARTPATRSTARRRAPPRPRPPRPAAPRGRRAPSPPPPRRRAAGLLRADRGDAGVGPRYRNRTGGRYYTAVPAVPGRYLW